MKPIVDAVKRVPNLRLVKEINDDGLFDVAAGVESAPQARCSWHSPGCGRPALSS